MSTLAERIEQVIEECRIKQTVFAKSLGVTPNYISMIVHGKKELISPTLALLIEYLYGYSSQWLLTGEGEKMDEKSLRRNINKKLEAMDVENLKKVDDYINTI